MIGALLVLALGSVDPCAAVTPAETPDPGIAADYRAVGDREARDGDAPGAAYAYRQAAALDPDDAASRRALRRLCAPPAPAARPDPFDDGLLRMQAGDLRGAVESFEVARQGGDRSAAFLEGICRYQLGDDAEAAPLLAEAAQDPAHRDLARFYEGLVALRQGRADEAAQLFDATSSVPGIGAMATTLARTARRDGHLILSVLVQGGYDSNVPLLPNGTALSTGSMGMGNGDGFVDVVAGALWRPLGPSGPYLRATGVIHQLFRLTAYDLDTVEAAAGWQVVHGGDGLVGEVAYDDQAFGGTPWLQAPRLLGSGWLTTGAVTWTATYFARFETYDGGYAPFSGTVQSAELKAAWPISSSALLDVAWDLTRDAARLDITSYWAQGPRAELHAILSSRARLGLSTSAVFQRYDGFDATLGARQTDAFLSGSALAEYDLSDGWTARLSVDALQALSNVSAFRYDKIVPMIGIAWTAGM